MDELLLKTTTGRPTGTRAARRMRRDGHVPAVVYGLGQDPLPLTVEWVDLRKALTTEAGVNALLTLDIEGQQQLSIVKDIQRHPVRRDVIHVDFIRLDPDAEVEVDVPVVLEGDARKVTDLSGMVDQVMFALSVYSRPDGIPTELTVDVSDLEVGESLKVSEIALPEGVRTEVDPDEPIANAVVTRSTLESMRAAEEAEAAAEEAEGAAEGEEGAAEGGEDAAEAGDDD